MHFDPIDARLVATTDEFEQLVQDLADGRLPDGDATDQVATMVGLVLDPQRSVVIERLDRDGVRPLHVGFDDAGRATVTERRADGTVVVTASHVSLLPALLLQSLRVHPGLEIATERAAVTVDESGLGAALDQLAGPGGPTATWRAFGSWSGGTVDADLRIVSTGERGLWEVGRSAASADVTLRPRTVAETAARLGDVVTGRTRTPEPV